MIRREVKIPADWMPVIDAARGETEFAEFVRECIRQSVGPKNLPEANVRGRPPKRESP